MTDDNTEIKSSLKEYLDDNFRRVREDAERAREDTERAREDIERAREDIERVREDTARVREENLALHKQHEKLTNNSFASVQRTMDELKSQQQFVLWWFTILIAVVSILIGILVLYRDSNVNVNFSEREIEIPEIVKAIAEQFEITPKVLPVENNADELGEQQE